MEENIKGITLGAFTEAHAIEVSTWQYPGIYSVYNLVPWAEIVENHWSLSDEDLRKEQFHTIYLNGEMIGFGRIQKAENRIDLGIGLKPECCGQGLGLPTMRVLVAKAEAMFPGEIISLEVRQFNERAIKCYEKAGFKVVKKYMKEMISGFVPFALMIKI